MKTYNETLVSTNTIPTEPISGGIPLDYAESNTAEEIDKGIRDTIAGIRLSILAMGLGLANMKAKGLYNNLGCLNMTQYIRKLCEETKMERSGVFNWLCIGETYLKYRNDLETIGFSDSDGPSKLPYLKRALERNEKQEVFDNIKTMSVREFANFAKTQIVTDRPNRRRGRWKMNIRGNSIYIDGKLAIVVSKKIDPRVSDYVMKVIRVICETVEKEGVILPIRLRNMREVNILDAAVDRFKAQMGMR